MDSVPDNPTVEQMIHDLFQVDEYRVKLEHEMHQHNRELQDITTLRYRMIEDGNPDYQSLYEFRLNHETEVMRETISALWRRMREPEGGAE